MTDKAMLEAAKLAYVEAARACWAAWTGYVSLGGREHVAGWRRFFLPAPDGHVKTDDGGMFDPNVL